MYQLWLSLAGTLFEHAVVQGLLGLEQRAAVRQASWHYGTSHARQGELTLTHELAM